jgi:hypothetical protein
MNRLFASGLAATLLASASAASAATFAYVAPLAPARDLPPVGQVTAIFDNVANLLRLRVQTAPGSLAPGSHQLHLHANYAGNLLIGQPLTEQVKAVPPATTDDIDGDGVIEVFEAVPFIGESWWTVATVTVGADGALEWESGPLSTAANLLFPPDPLVPGSPGVSGPEDVDYPVDVDNIGFYRPSLDWFDLLAFDIHGGPDPVGIGAGPGEIDQFDGYEDLRPALAGSFAAVPEPASWAMMIGGFGFIGAVARRRRVRFAL